MFTPGQHVIFIGSPSYKSLTPYGRFDGDPILTKGSVYVVAEVYPAGFVFWAGLAFSVACLSVEGMPLFAFAAPLFRPISKTSIEIVESLMAPVNAPGKVTEPA